MFDFLDKTGLKTALEQIKAKFPSSLPANGGNADTVAHKSIDEIFYSNYLGGITDIDNTDGSWTTGIVPGVGAVSGTFPTDCPTWIVINQYQISSKDFKIQTCHSVEPNPEATPQMWFRNKYVTNEIWTDWKKVSTTPIKKISFQSVGTNIGGGGSLFSADFGTPITIACTSRGDTQCTPFYYGDGNFWLLLAKDASTLDPIPAGSYSFDVWYI